MEREEIQRLIKNERKVKIVLKSGSRYTGYLISIDGNGIISMKDTRDEPFYLKFNLDDVSELIMLGGLK